MKKQTRSPTVQMPPDFPQKMIDQMLRIFAVAEVEKRISAGTATKPYPLFAFQVVFHKNKPNQIRLNAEVQAKFSVTVKPGAQIVVGRHLGMADLESVEKIQFEAGDGNEAHFTAVKLGTKWFFTTDLRYDRHRARQKGEIASEFMENAIECRRRKQWRPFIESAWLAAEQFASAELILTPIYKVEDGKTHNFWKTHYAKWAYWGNAEKEHAKTLKDLHELMPKARYQETDFKVHPETAARIVRVLLEMQQRIQKLAL